MFTESSRTLGFHKQVIETLLYPSSAALSFFWVAWPPKQKKNQLKLLQMNFVKKKMHQSHHQEKISEIILIFRQ
jgi:hypothetical protein